MRTFKGFHPSQLNDTALLFTLQPIRKPPSATRAVIRHDVISLAICANFVAAFTSANLSAPRVILIGARF